MAVNDKILIIDDNRDDIEITKIALEEIGRQEMVEVSTGGEEALKHLRSGENLPALILLDLKMPGMSGFDVLREIRADERLRPVPVVVVTSSTLDSDRQKACSGGANGFLCKEVDIDRFGHTLKTVIAAFL